MKPVNWKRSWSTITSSSFTQCVKRDSCKSSCVRFDESGDNVREHLTDRQSHFFVRHFYAWTLFIVPRYSFLCCLFSSRLRLHVCQLSVSLSLFVWAIRFVMPGFLEQNMKGHFASRRQGRRKTVELGNSAGCVSFFVHRIYSILACKARSFI